MNERPQIPVWFLFAVMALMSLTAAGFLYLGTRLGSAASLPQEEVKVMALVYDQVKEKYYRELSEQDERELMEEAIKGMVKSLDQYSRFIPKREKRVFDESTKGIYYGIGAWMHAGKGEVIILYPFPRGPAEGARLEPGDRVFKVNDTLLADLPQTNIVREAAKLIKGEKAGTEVVLGVRRNGREFDQPVKRNAVPQPSVRWVRLLDPEKGIGYAYLSDFVDNSVKEFDIATQVLHQACRKAPCGKLKGLILDLRENTGGALNICVALANRFVKEGTIVTLRRPRDNKVIETHAAKPELCTLADVSLVLIVNQHSASASEVLAGALQDYERARVVGQRTYGKGLVQSILSWEGLPIRLKITTSEYRTPKNRNIHRPRRRTNSLAGDQAKNDSGGIDPDVSVAVTKKQRMAIYARLAEYEVPPRYRKRVEKLAAELKIELMQPFGPDRDPQLRAALEEARKLLAGQSGQSPDKER